ncbi:Glu-tRNA(Gln) amidotransferase subunit GatD [Candidatus Micrarchaeota archaeon]|nr:Glu-tRNA(Gln) amidotransferase subunit GatD [Candidatus Micrarchaeota archaeon]
MYSRRLLEEFRKNSIETGDRIRVVSAGAEYSGFLMPRPAGGDDDTIVLKLDNGYNTGLKAESVELIAKAPKKPPAPANEAGPVARGGIAILGCGGTIASKIEYRTGAVYPSITPRELRMAFPTLKKWDIHSRQIFSLFSEDMGAKHWRMLADAIEDEIKDGSEGVVVMHGTDTMTYTSAAISYMLQNLPVPIVLVGSQRSSDRPSSENEMNMLNSVYSATQDLGEVAVCMHASTSDDYCHLHRGTRVRKMHTSRRDAFHSINAHPLAAVDYRSKRFERLSEWVPRRKGGLVAKKELNDNVAMVYIHPNIRPDLFARLDDYDGIVLVGTGLGHTPANAFEDKTVKGVVRPIRELVSSGIPVAMASQCISGRICMRVYSSGRLLMEAGVIGDGADWTPEAAYAKMCWARGQAKDVKEIGRLMMENVAGEITARSAIEGY